MGRPSFGPVMHHKFPTFDSASTYRPTNVLSNELPTASPQTLAEAIPGMREVGRYPNITGGYSLLYDTSSDEFVLFSFPAGDTRQEPPPGMKPSETGMIYMA